VFYEPISEERLAEDIKTSETRSINETANAQYTALMRSRLAEIDAELRKPAGRAGYEHP
jgi:hypothetical protein